MAITAVAATYRARIADRGASTVSGNVALTLAVSDLAGIPTLSGPSVDILRGSSTSHPFDLECIVDTVLFLDGGRLATIGRLIEIQRSEDDGGSWSTLATGRISGASEIDGKGKITLSVSDERWVERDTEIFTETSTVQLHPPGLASAWADFEAAGNETYTVESVDGDAVLLEADRIATASKDLTVPRSLRVALATDLVATQDLDHSATNSGGNFTSLRFDLVSGAPSPGDRNVIGFSHNLSQLATPVSILSGMRPAGDGKLISAWVYFGAAHGLTGGETITGRFYFNAPIRVRESVPLHVGGENGVHPMTFLRDILDGTYGGQSMSYPSAVLDALEALSLPPVWARITEPKDRARWNEANHFRPYGIAPLTGTDLQYRPTYIALPQDEDPTGLPVLTAADGATAEWDHGSRDLVTAIELTARFAYELDFTSDRGDDWPADEIGTEKVTTDIEHDNVATLGRIARRYDTELIFATDSLGGQSVANDVVRTLADALFRVFGDGAQKGSVTVPDDAGHQVGDLVLLDQDTLKGFNPNTGARTGDRLVRLITPREMRPDSTIFEYLDMGPDDQPLTAPTVSIAQNGTDADLVDVTISNLPAGSTAIVQVTESATTPSETAWADRVRSGVGNETVSFRMRAASGTAWARAKSVAPLRIESPWASDSVSLSTRALIRGMGVTRTTLTDFSVIWRVNSGTTGGIRADYDVHDRNAAPVIDGTNQQDFDATDGGFDVAGALRSTAQMVTVRLTPYPTFSGGAVSGTAGDPLERHAIIVQVRGSRAIFRATLAAVEVDFDANGQVVVSAQADDEAATILVTVGDGSSPADPTAGANDGSISGRSGSVSTGVKITTGSVAFVKAVAADLGGNLGPVTEVKQARRIGPFHKNTTTRSHTGDTAETTLETITIPANTLGSNGSLRIEVRYDYTGTASNKTLRVKLNTDTIFGLISTSATDQYSQVLLFNDGATNDQQAVGFTASSSGSVSLINNETLAEDSTANMDIVITAELGNAGDQIDLILTHAELIGTD